MDSSSPFNDCKAGVDAPGDISDLTSSQTGSGLVGFGLLPKLGRTFFSVRQKAPGRWRLSEASLSLLFVCMISLSEMPGGFMYGLISNFRMRGIINACYCHCAIIIMVMQSVKYICLLRSSVIGFCCIDAIKRISEPIR